MASLGPSRPVGVIAQEIAGYRIDMAVFRRSNKCQDITRDDTKTLCEPILKLYREQGVAARKVEIEPKIAEARKKLEGRDPPKSADPQAEAWSKATGYDETLIAYGMMAVLGLAIEIVACFGTWIAMRPSAPVEKVEANDNNPVQSDADQTSFPVPPVDDKIIPWVRTFRARYGRNPQIPEVQRAHPGTAKTTAWRRIKAA